MAKKKPNTAFGYAKTQEKKYATSLRKIARDIDYILKNNSIDDAVVELIEYSKFIKPLANDLGSAMISDAFGRSTRAFLGQAGDSGKDLRRMLSATETGAKSLELLFRQVDLITTLPLKTAEKAQKIAVQAVGYGERADDITASIAELGNLTYYEATRIARTEIAKTNATINRQRADLVGATHYIWRSVGDSNTRETHLDMDGKVCEYANPPDVGDGFYHAGEIYNCRCYAEPILTAVDLEDTI
jgi:SPP1 gp7 family putative phage head morphogenesis protein